MENFPRADRTVGETTEEQVGDFVSGAANEVFRFKIKELQKEKTPEELKVISLVNQVTSELREKYGLSAVELRPENVFIIPADKWSFGEEFGRANLTLKYVVVKEDTPSNILHTMLHETLHVKSYVANQVTIGENPEMARYRVGLAMIDRKGENKTFQILNEAITEELAIKTLRDMQEGGQLAAEKSGITFVGTASNNAYESYRDWFNYQLTDLYDKNMSRFKSQEEIKELFFKSMMTGNILPIARLVEKTFGKGTFRKWGEFNETELERYLLYKEVGQYL